jgi:hypothetical protein
MMRALTAAACGQARIVAGLKRGRKRAQAKEQNQDDGKRAPHLQSMVQQVRALRNEVKSYRRAVRYHRVIQSAKGLGAKIFGCTETRERRCLM